MTFKLNKIGVKSLCNKSFKCINKCYQRSWKVNHLTSMNSATFMLVNFCYADMTESLKVNRSSEVTLTKSSKFVVNHFGTCRKCFSLCCFCIKNIDDGFWKLFISSMRENLFSKNIWHQFMRFEEGEGGRSKNVRKFGKNIQCWVFSESTMKEETISINQ